MIKKKRFLAPLALLAAFVFTGCSTTTIVARPTWIDDTVVNGDLKDNTYKKIYDAIKELGDTNSSTLNDLLYKLAEKEFGSYSDIIKFGSKTYDEVKNDSNFKNFINSTSAYKCTNEFIVDSTTKESRALNDEEKMHVSFNNLKIAYEEIRENIYKNLYTDVTSGSYSTDSEFYEEKYITNNLFKNLYINKTNWEKFKAAAKAKVELPLKKRDSEESYEDYIILNNLLSGFTSEAQIDPTKNEVYGEYISRKIIPEIFRTLLIENYVKEQRFSVLGRSYARKVNILTVANGGDAYKTKIYNMLKYFVNTYITGETITSDYDFTLIDEAMRGFVGTDTSGAAYTLLTQGGFEKIQITDSDSNKYDLIWYYSQGGNSYSTYVYKGTKLGDLVESFMKIYDLTYADTGTYEKGNFTITLKSNYDESAFNDFTGTSSHTIEEGITLKEREIRKTTYSKEGWYLKNGGLSDLNSTYRDRLFNIATSSIIDSDKDYVDGDYVKYYTNTIAGKEIKHAFLTYKTDASASESDLVVIDDGSNYVIAEVMEAVSTSKLNTNQSNKQSYYYLNDGTGVESIDRFNRIANKVIIESASGDTYKKNANQYYLMLSNIVIHDQSLYDYIKGQYPDIFN